MALAAHQKTSPQSRHDYFTSKSDNFHVEHQQHSHNIMSLIPASNEKPRSVLTNNNSISTVNTLSINEYPSTNNEHMLQDDQQSSIRQNSLPRSQLSLSQSAETDPTPYSDSEIIPPSGPKRYSTSFNLAPASSFKKSAQTKQNNRLTRNHTTAGISTEVVSEDFAKELSARQKAFRRLSRRKPVEEDEDRVLMGTRISEGHQNYILMYNMLTGIRIAVGRVSAKLDRPLVDQDFSAAHKLAFDV
jgi:1-phosphatidylinositol-4-phosphate 5-kinase